MYSSKISITAVQFKLKKRNLLINLKITLESNLLRFVIKPLVKLILNNKRFREPTRTIYWENLISAYSNTVVKPFNCGRPGEITFPVKFNQRKVVSMLLRLRIDCEKYCGVL